MEQDGEFADIYARVASRGSKFTMAPMERCYALYHAVRYVVEKEIPGDIVECGVWRGGSAMLAALTLIRLNRADRNIFLYDTYEGMSQPGEKDVDIHGVPYRDLLDKEKKILSVGLEEVRDNMWSTGYPREKIRFVQGLVQETIPAVVPQRISLLRLDTDFYESTLHELVHLYPLVAPLGVILIDDYGHFLGAKEATDSYFKENKSRILLNRIDYSCRVGIKPAE
jgi:hypothetical protein